MTDRHDNADDAGGKDTAPEKHTPGPWHFGSGFTPGDTTFDLFGAGGRSVISCASYENMWLSAYDKQYDAANARLIAAAPDLLEMLQYAVNTIEAMRPTFSQIKDEGHAYHDQVLDVAKATIRKALGND